MTDERTALAALADLRRAVRTAWLTGIPNFREKYDAELFAVLGVGSFNDLGVDAFAASAALPALMQPITVGPMVPAALSAQMPSPPPECQSEAEKTAFAFGWWKAQETAASRATECEQKQPNTDAAHLAEGGNTAVCGDEAAAPLTACPTCGAKSDEEAGEMCFGEPCPMCFTDDWAADLAELNRRIGAADEGMPK